MMRVNLQAMHLWQGANEDASNPDNYFLAGAVITAELVKVDAVWKISDLVNKKVWRSGGGFMNMEKTDK